MSDRTDVVGAGRNECATARGRGESRGRTGLRSGLVLPSPGQKCKRRSNPREAGGQTKTEGHSTKPRACAFQKCQRQRRRRPCSRRCDRGQQPRGGDNPGRDKVWSVQGVLFSVNKGGQSLTGCSVGEPRGPEGQAECAGHRRADMGGPTRARLAGRPESSDTDGGATRQGPPSGAETHRRMGSGWQFGTMASVLELDGLKGGVSLGPLSCSVKTATMVNFDGQDGGAGRHTEPPCTAKRTTNLKMINNRNSQKTEPCGSPTTQEAEEEDSSDWRAGRRGPAVRRQLEDRGGRGGSWPSGRAHICVQIHQEEHLGSETDRTAQGPRARK